MTLNIPVPILSQDDPVSSGFAAEKPIRLTCGPITFPEGTFLTPADAFEFGHSLYRKQAGGAIEVWDEAGRTWLPETAVIPLQPLFYQELAWHWILVALGQKDKDGQDKFYTDRTSGFPRYFVRCHFRGVDAQGTEHIGTSLDSQPVAVRGMTELWRAGLAFEPHSPFTAKEVRLFLKDSGWINERGKVLIREEDGGFRIELQQTNGATLALMPDGTIDLSPGFSNKVQINGEVNVTGTVTAKEHIPKGS